MAQVLYATDDSGNLCTINSSSAIVSTLGSIPEVCTAIAFDSTDLSGATLYGGSSDSATPHADSLLALDPTTGGGTLIAAFSGATPDALRDMDVNSTDAEIWGLTEDSSGGHSRPVVHINKSSGAITVLNAAQTGKGCTGFVIDPAGGTAYMTGDGTTNLYQVDLGTGATTNLGTISGFGFTAGALLGMTFDEHGVLWAINSGGWSLGQLDISTRTWSIVAFLSRSFMTGMSWQPDLAPPPPTAVFESAYWQFVVGDLNSFEVLSFLNKLASDRTVTFTLNQPASATGKVASDNPEINIAWPSAGDDPFLSEGNRVLWGLRREGGSPVWTIRYAGYLLQLEDDAQSDNAYTTYTSWDPWQYLFSRPVCKADGTLPGVNGYSFSSTRVDVIAATLLKNTIVNQGDCGIDAGALYGGTVFWSGTIDASLSIDINFAQGTSVGDAWQQLCNANYCDIILNPIYDPINRPGYLVEFNIYDQAGSERDNAIFAWDMPSRSLVGIHRLIEGSKRANEVKFFAGQGGTAPGGQGIAVQDDATSVAKYGEYWLQVFLPGQTNVAAVTSLAQAQLALAKDGRTTVTFSPAPQRSPIPFSDYFLGDTVPVYASNRFRAPIGSVAVQYQRIYGIPLMIADDATEQVQQMLTAIPNS